MVEFNRVLDSRLFISSDNLAKGGWWGFLSSPGVEPPTDPVPLGRALEDLQLNGSFIYSAISPLLDSKEQVDTLIGKLDEVIGPQRALLWLANAVPGSLSPTTAFVQRLTSNSRGISTNSGFDAPLVGYQGDERDSSQVFASTNAGAIVTVADDGGALVFTGGALPAVTLAGPMAPTVVQPDTTALLVFTGQSQGCFKFSLSIQRRSLYEKLAWGFQVLVPNAAVVARASRAAALSGETKDRLLYLSAWLPLADGDAPRPTDYIGFAIELNVVNPNNSIAGAARTVFYFTGKNDPGSSEPDTRLVSYYRTAFGSGVSLFPIPSGTADALQGGLVPNPGYLKTPNYNGFSFAPVGDFFLRVDGATPAAAAADVLLCGLSGSETISFLSRTDGAQASGSRVRFFGGQAAYAPQFPIQQSSAVGIPIDPAASLLTDAFQTSWANVLGAPLAADLAHYAAAPRGADPFGKPVVPPDSGAAGDARSLLVPRDPGIVLANDEGLFFPLLPLAGFAAGTGEQDLTADQLDLLERQIIGPTRRTRITNAKPRTSSSAAHSLRLSRAQVSDSPFNTTTPAGFIARVDDGAWSRLLLAQVMDATGTRPARQLGFTSLLPELQAAFQTDNLFLVVANGKYLGKPESGVMPDDPAPGAAPAFYDTLNIDEWEFAAGVGTGSAYGDYRNVMIVKGVRGKLVDLVNGPEKWTQKDRFAAPTGASGEPDVSQLIPLSAWLSAYFADANAKRDDPYFQDFCRIIEDDNWQGVLILRVDLTEIPKALLGILAGVTDMSSFNAHHLGIEISQIDGSTVQQVHSSSLFGLVHYVDPSYDDKLPPHAITPADMTAEYEFTVLTLKALFRNTAVQKFESVAQVVLNDLFGSRVSEMVGGNSFNAVLLGGAYQMNGTAPVYTLSALSPASFRLSNNILLSVDIANANMATRDDGASSGEVVSWIAMSGRMSFAIVTAADQPNFDIFSFGSDAGSGGDGQGLSFAALGLRIAYPIKSPQRTLPTLEEREIFFNVSDSQVRPNSLFKNLQLELRGLLSGDDTSAPASLGYLTVATPYGLQGVEKRRWHGLSFLVNMGTPGALAGKINLSSTLLVAWADDSGAEASDGFSALVGLELPGTGAAGELFSLQTVLKVSVGVIRLLYNQEKNSFLLLMNEIALKFFGLLKLPPNGSTSFFLFGNPEATDPTGLGWYAIYNQDVVKPATATSLDDAASAPALSQRTERS